MPPDPSLDQERYLDEVIAEYLEAIEAGRVVDRDELLRRHPELADELTAFFADQDRFHQLVAPLRLLKSELPPTISYAITGQAPPPAPITATANGQPLALEGYEVLGEIARSGMGIVYRARQTRLNRVVALKMILAGPWASTDDLVRFRLETEAVALLDHPHIVPIYEVGEHEGRPFYSMKLIEGVNLAQHLSRQSLPSHEAAGLLAIVARAVDYAHQRGILHRDLKPANILIDTHGQPYLTDFGLAKQCHGGPNLTPAGMAVGTPGYMAPEQAAPARGNGGPPSGLTTRADVYSLGAILYEMLTGRPPFRAATPLDTLLEVLEREPPRPRLLSPSVDRDLETICLKCLHKEPGKRYASAAALADDLERYRRGESIRARPAGLFERFRLWCRRQPVIALLVGGLFLSLAAGLALAIWQRNQAVANRLDAETRRVEAESLKKDAYDHLALLKQRNEEIEKQKALAQVGRLEAEKHKKTAEEHAALLQGQNQEVEKQKALAEERFHQAHALVSDFCTRLDRGRWEDTPATQAMRKELLNAARGYYEKFLAQRGQDPRLQSELAATHFQIGMISADLGSTRDAGSAFQEARKLYEQMLARQPGNPDLRYQLSRVLHNLAMTQGRQSHVGDALASFRRGRRLLEELCKESHKSREVRSREIRIELALLCNNLGNLLKATGQLAEAEACYEQKVALMKGMADTDPKDEQSHVWLADGYLHLGDFQASTGHGDRALRSYRAAEKLLEDLLRAGSTLSKVQQVLGAIKQQIAGRLDVAGDTIGSRACLDEALDVYERLTKLYPTTAVYQVDRAACLRQLGHLLRGQKHNDEARKAYLQAQTVMENLVQRHPSSLEYQNDLAKCYFDRGIIENRLGNQPEALKALQKAADLRRPLVQARPDFLPWRYDLAITLIGLALRKRDAGDASTAFTLACEARDHYRVAYGRAERMTAYRQGLVNAELVVGDLLRERGRLEEAVTCARAAMGLEKNNPTVLYQAAGDLARCASAASKGAKPLSAAQAARSRKYAGLALGGLRQAIDAGFKNAKRLARDDAWDALRSLPEFAALAARIEKKTDPQK